MKKKLLTILMAMTMTAMLITGCGEKEDTSGDAKSSVEESKEDDEDESEDETEEESKEESEEANEEVAESSEEVAESIEEVVESVEAEESEEVVESSEEVVESVEEVEEVTEATEDVTETEEEEAEVDDTNNKGPINYDEYFQRTDIISDNVKITCTTESEDITFDLIVEVAGDKVRMCYNFDTLLFDMYATKEKVYAYCEMDGESKWVWAPVENEEDVDSIMEMTNSGLIDTESIESVKYRGVMDDDGVIYDKVDVVSVDGTTATYFVNYDTEKVEKCVMDQDGVSMVMLIDEIDSVEVPEEAEALATESTVEEIMMLMVGVMLGGAGSFE